MSRSEPISRPIFIVGQPRTGTTILFDLLAQDPQLRPPLTWEVDNPYPLPRPETYDTDPRIAEIAGDASRCPSRSFPACMTFHPMGALVGQECVRITAGQFCSMIFSVQYRLPTYYQWLLYDADHRPAYRYHRIFLQHLQSGVPRPMAAEVTRAPVAARHAGRRVSRCADRADPSRPAHRHLVDQRTGQPPTPAGLRRDNSIADCAQQYVEEIVVGLERGMTLRDRRAGRRTRWSTCSSPISSATRSPPSDRCMPNSVAS